MNGARIGTDPETTMSRTVLAACTLALALWAAAVHAAPILDYTWGDPPGLVVNQDWSGPHAYTQTLSMTGMSGTVTQVHVSVMTKSHNPPLAWTMTTSGATPAPDCLGSPAFTATTTVAGAQGVPGATLSVTGELVSPWPRIEVDVRFDPPLVADPAVRYALATLRFDHANSVPGESTPAACGGADRPFCFVTAWAGVTHGAPDYTLEYATTDAGILTWQGADEMGCLGAIPTRPTTWGKLKTIFR